MAGDELTSFQYLRTLAVARVMLDNFPNVQASWVTQGGKIGQVSLRFGANDFGSLMIEENVVSAAGAHFRLTEAEIARNIQDAGFVPKRRTMHYEIVGDPYCWSHPVSALPDQPRSGHLPGRLSAMDVTQREPCATCAEPVALEARLCPYCGRSALVALRLAGPVADGRLRYQAARALAALGAPLPPMGELQKALAERAAPAGHGPDEGACPRGAARRWRPRACRGSSSPRRPAAAAPGSRSRAAWRWAWPRPRWAGGGPCGRRRPRRTSRSRRCWPWPRAARPARGGVGTGRRLGAGAAAQRAGPAGPGLHGVPALLRLGGRGLLRGRRPACSPTITSSARMARR